MIPRIHGTRSSIGATIAYFQRETAPGKGRVADVGFVELPPGLTLDTAGRIMHATVREQSRIKALRGISARGRPTREPYYHLSLSWHPDERPARPVVEEAVEGALKSLGLEGHQGIWCAHSDTKAFHVHILTSRIAWETGRTVRMSNDRRKLSAWALAHEKQHGGVQVETRVKREAWRAEGRDLRQQREGATAHGDTIAIGDLSRAMATHRRAWPTAERTRGPGREARSAEDREEWAATFACQRAQPNADPAVLRLERVRLSRRQGRRRRLKKRVAQAGDVVVRARAVVGDVSRVAKEAAGAAVGGSLRAARVGKDIAMLGGLVALAGTAQVVAVGIGVATRVLVMQQMRGVLSENPGLRAALRAKHLSARRELGAAAGRRYLSEPWSSARVRELTHYLEGLVPRDYRPPVGLLVALGRMQWVVPGPSARGRATPGRTGASEPTSRLAEDRVTDRSETRAVSTRARTEPRPPPERPGRATQADGKKAKRGLSRN